MEVVEQQNETVTQSLGVILSAAREQKGLSQKDMAKELRLSVQTIIDIESDHYQHCGAPIYVRGYLKGMARLLGLDEEGVLGLFAKTPWAIEQLDIKPSQSGVGVRPISVMTRKKQRHMLRWSVLALLVVIVLLVASWWHSQQHHPHSVVSDMPALSLPQQNLPKKKDTGQVMTLPVADNTKKVN